MYFFLILSYLTTLTSTSITFLYESKNKVRAYERFFNNPNISGKLLSSSAFHHFYNINNHDKWHNLLLQFGYHILCLPIDWTIYSVMVLFSKISYKLYDSRLWCVFCHNKIQKEHRTSLTSESTWITISYSLYICTNLLLSINIV